MKQNAGLIAVVTVFLAFFGISNLPKSTPSPGTASETANKSKSHAKPNGSKTPVLSPACEEIGERLKPFLEKKPPVDNGNTQQDWQRPGFCYDGGKAPQETYESRLSPDVHFVIATAPNPISTHLPLLFDRLIEVIEQAAQDDKYAYDSSWFPWDEAKDYSSLTDQLLAEKALKLQQTQPGVVVFRHAVDEELMRDRDHRPYQIGLVVFVVAEQPTGGIDRKEFESALTWIKWLGGLSPARPLKILGPSFSGSLPSLDQALDSDKLKQVPITVSSGSVSSQSSYLWFQDRIRQKHSGIFLTAKEGDLLMVDRLLQYLDGQNYPLGCVAIISEDETAFGQTQKEESSDKDNQDTRCGEEANQKKHPIYLYYPRDIATLRSAYERQSILSTGKQGSTGNAASTTLRGDLSEPDSSDHDTVRSYGGELTPLAQESVLLSVVNILKARRIQFVVLRSTNSLDQIFLAQFFKRAYPAARIVIDAADLLFARGAEGSSLRGVMTLSTYPLLTWQQDWTSPMHPKNRSYRIFGQDSAEGLYIAARELFLDPNLCDFDARPCKVPIGNYATPAWALASDGVGDGQRPATWLSVIGHHQFWPVAVLQSKGSKNKICELLPTVSCRRDDLQDDRAFTDAHAHPLPIPSGTDCDVLPAATCRGGEPVAAVDADARHPLRIPTELVILLIACSVWSGLHCLWCWRGSIKPFPALFRLAQFAPLPMKQHPALITFGSFLLAAVAVVTAAACGLRDGSLNGWRAAVLAVWCVSTVLASCLACGKNYTLPRVKGSPSTDDKSGTWQRGAAGAGVLFFFAFLGLHVWLVSKLDLTNKIPAYWRSAHLLSGVSGLMPQLLLIVGMYLWFWFSLRGLALFGEDRPLLPKLDSLPLLNSAKDNCPSLSKLDRLPPLDPAKRKSLMPVFSRDNAAEPVKREAIPVGSHYLITLLLTFLATSAVFGLVLEGYTLRTIAERSFGTVMFIWLSLCIAIVLADTAQLWVTWRKLRPLLVYLDRVPLRRTLKSLPELLWKSVWTVSGNTLEERYRLISRQFESLRHLRNRLEDLAPKNSANEDEDKVQEKVEALEKVEACLEAGQDFVKWYVDPDSNFNEIEPLQKFQEELAATAGSVMTNLLLPAWHGETDSLILDGTPGDPKAAGQKEEADKTVPHAAPENVPPYLRAAEEFFVLPYLGFIQNTLGRMRTMILGSLFLFVAATFAVSSYPFDPLPVLGGVFLAVFTIAGGTLIVVFAQMHRDATLSHITNTEPGELGGQFWLHLFTFGVGPLLGLLTTLFPSITNFVSSWLQPGTQALK